MADSKKAAQESAAQNDTPAKTKKSKSKPKNKPTRGWVKKALFGILALLVLSAVIAIAVDYQKSLRVVSVEGASDVNPRGGVISIHYNQPISRPLYMAELVQTSVAVDSAEPLQESAVEEAADTAAQETKAPLPPLNVMSTISEDGRTQTITLLPPTQFNSEYRLVPFSEAKFSPLFNFFEHRPKIDVKTAIERLALKSMTPAPGTSPAPETLNNQIVLDFHGSAIGPYKRRIKIYPREMQAVRMTPQAPGYFRWSNDSRLSFNFTEPPKFNTEYKFEIDPALLVNPEYQQWVGKETEWAIKTSINEVYVSEYSVDDTARWNEPLRITFSGVMVRPQEVLKPKAISTLPITLNPEVDGVWRWINARNIEFKPDPVEGWPARQNVTLAVAPSINQMPDRLWRKGEQAEQHQFKVLPRQQSITRINLNGENVGLEAGLVIDFSRKMVPKSELGKSFKMPLSADISRSETQVAVDNSEPYIKIQLSGPSHVPILMEPRVPGKFRWVRANRLKFTPDNMWPQLTELKLYRNTAYNPDGRYEWQGLDSHSFKTAENLLQAKAYLTPEQPLSVTDFYADQSRYRIQQVAPDADASRKDSEPPVTAPSYLPEQRLWLSFDSNLQDRLGSNVDLAQGVQITPAIDGDFTWLTPSLLEFVPSNNWAEDTHYEINLGPELFYHPEQHLPADWQPISFKTDLNRVRSAQISSENVPHEQGVLPLTFAPDESLTLTFSKNLKLDVDIGRDYPLNDAGEAAGLSIQPAFSAKVEWRSRREVIIKPNSYWLPATEYLVTLNNRLLPQPQSKYEHGNKFYIATTTNALKVQRFTPNGRTGKRVVLDAHFNRAIKPKDLPLGSIDDRGLLALTPAVAGNWKWLASNKLQFVPEQPLQASTEYTVRVNPEVVEDKQFTWHAFNKKGQPKNARFSFDTGRLRVVNSNAVFKFNPDNILQQRFFLTIELSDYVQESELRKYFNLYRLQAVEDDDAIEIPLQYQLQNSEKRDDGLLKKFAVVSQWADRPAENQRVEYSIAEGLAPAKGNMPLLNEYQGYFLQERPQELYIYDLTWQREQQRYVANLVLSAPVKPEALQQKLKVETRTKKTPVNYRISVGEPPFSGVHSYLIEPYLPKGTEPGEAESVFKGGHYYRFILDKELLAVDGAFNVDSLEKLSGVPNFEATMKFARKGKILPQKQLQSIPVLTTNIEGFYLSVDRIYSNNVSYFLNNMQGNDNLQKIAKRIHNQYHAIKDITGTHKNKNQELITHVDLSEVIEAHDHGLYRVCISHTHSEPCSSEQDYYYWNQGPSADRRWVVATDIGLVSRQFNNTMVLWTHSLASTNALAGVKVTAYDKWNQPIASGLSSANGHTELELPEGAKPTHVLATLGKDFSYLDLRKQQVQHPRSLTEGIAADDEALRAYIYSERGVYRPGDTAHLVAVMRGKNGVLPRRSSMRFEIFDPNGRQFDEERFSMDSQGLYANDIELPAEAPTGRWRAVVHQNQAGSFYEVGSYTFQVEEFIPNKIKVRTQAVSKTASPGKELQFKAIAQNLFGPPAAGNVVNAKVSLRPQYFRPKGHNDFTFGHDENRFQRIEQSLPETRLNDQGEALYRYQIPENIDSPIGLRAHYSATVLDDGGRGVTAYGSVDVHLYEQYAGVRAPTGRKLSLGDDIRFETVNVLADGSAVPAEQQGLRARIYRDKAVTHYRKNERGYYRYVNEVQRLLVIDLADPRDADGGFSYEPEYTGDHILELEDQVSGHVTRYPFYVAGEGADTDSATVSDKVQMKLLSNQLNVGGIAKVQLTSPFAGKVLLTAEQAGLLFSKVLDVGTEPVVVGIPVTQAHFPNFYVSTMAVRPVSQAGRKQPLYASGLLNVQVADIKQYPALQLNAPEQVRPKQTFKVSLNVPPPEPVLDADGNPSTQKPATMYFTLAAVDVGILDLTQFQTPNLKGYFEQKRRLEVKHAHMYGDVMTYTPEGKLRISPSGDAPPRSLVKKKRVNPDAEKRVKSAVLWSGVLSLDEQGYAEVEFTAPDFDGTMRLMAVAYGESRFASADTEMAVRDDLVLRPSLPRFAASGDDFVIPAVLYNTTNSAMQLQLKADASPHFELRGNTEQALSIAPNSKAEHAFAVRVGNTLGLGKITLTATLADASHQVSRSTAIPVRSAGNSLSLAGGGKIVAGEPRTISFPDTLVPGSDEWAMLITANPLAEFKAGLGYLLQYPHGCLEQTTSKAFPLLYYADLIAAKGNREGGGAEARGYVKAAIEKLQRMQLNDGRMAYWEGSRSVNDWAFIFASHFLVEAKNAGYEVRHGSWNLMLKALRRMVKQPPESQNLYGYNASATGYLYSAYVLALAGDNVLGELNYVYDNYLEALRPHDKARLAAGLFKMGQQDIARNLVAQLDELNSYETFYSQGGGNFASNVRDLALLLDAFTVVSPESGQVGLLADKLMKQSQHGRWRNTQENAFALLALGKALSTPDFDIRTTVQLGDGSPVAVDKWTLLDTAQVQKGPVRIEVQGKGAVSYSWEAFGIEAKPQSLQVDEGLRIRRRFLTDLGKVADLSQVQQGDLLVAEISMQALGNPVKNVVITDLLPMGLEVENARLSTAASLAWIEQGIRADHVDIRDDRVNLFLTVPTKNSRYYYTTRAVTVGNYQVPMIRGEAMYKPEINSQADGGRLQVKARKSP